MIPYLARVLAGDTLPQAIARGEQAYTGDAFLAALAALHDAPAGNVEWQYLCADLSLYGRLLHEKALSVDPRE